MLKRIIKDRTACWMAGITSGAGLIAGTIVVGYGFGKLYEVGVLDYLYEDQGWPLGLAPAVWILLVMFGFILGRAVTRDCLHRKGLS